MKPNEPAAFWAHYRPPPRNYSLINILPAEDMDDIKAIQVTNKDGSFKFSGSQDWRVTCGSNELIRWQVAEQ